MKKIFATLLVLALALSAMFTLVACDGNGKSSKVMNISMNPEVEFILDANDKVLSVNALNEEGNLIITASATKFVGKDAEEATKLFVEVSKDLGFIVKGSGKVANNDINISISGDTATAEKLFNDVKTAVTEYFTAENITAKIENAAAITQEKLKEMVADCAPYIEEAKLNAMTQMELVEELYASRKETHDMYSQELKNAYYEAKASAMDTAKIQALKNQMGEGFGLLLEGMLETYNEWIAKLESTRMERLVSAESDYQVKLAELRAKKIELLQKRKELAEKEDVTDGELAILSNLEAAFDTIEAALQQLGVVANQSIDSVKEGLTTAYDLLVKGIESAQVVIADHMDAIMKFQTEQIPVFAAEFESSYADAVAKAKADWKAMKDQLQAQPQA